MESKHMNEQSHEAIAQNAWVIYKQVMTLEKNILKAFIDDFIRFEEQEQNQRRLQEEELPF
jgi:hypothetical protein